jgi:hypothetical protein
MEGFFYYRELTCKNDLLSLEFLLMGKRLTLIVLFIFCSRIIYCQDYFRIRADFTVKISNADGTKNLTKGVVYYDKNFKQLIYDVNFPSVEKWISKDTSLYKMRGNTVYERRLIPSINEFTIFHLSLNSRLNDFGLKNSIYKVSKVEKKGELVLSYWKIPEQAKSMMDHVVVAKKGNRLESVVVVGNQLKILSKQFYRNYVKIDAFEFPSKIIQIMYNESGGENYQVTEFKNIKVNDLENSMLYNINL